MKQFQSGNNLREGCQEILQPLIETHGDLREDGRPNAVLEATINSHAKTPIMTQLTDEVTERSTFYVRHALF